MKKTCTCGGKFLDAEDFRDHMPCPGTEVERLRAENERLRAALVSICAGKTLADTEHPLGDYASMAMRFMTIAQEALGAVTSGTDGGGE